MADTDLRRWLSHALGPGWPGRLLPHPRRTPLTFWYLAVLLGTAVYARHADPATVRAALAASSTDVWHLMHVPLRVLVLSALWSAGPVWSPYLLAFSLTLAPLERRIGSLRTLGVFATGHVLATLASELPIGVGVVLGDLGTDQLHRIDVGVSYGVLTCLGALLWLLPGRLRCAVFAVVAAMLLRQELDGGDPVTAVGHPVALLVGLVCGRRVRRWSAPDRPAAPQRRARGYAPARAEVRGESAG